MQGIKSKYCAKGVKESKAKQSQSTAFGRKSETRSSKSEMTTFDKAKLKKQSQFAGRQIERKLFPERRLWQNNVLQGSKKQSQTKPIFDDSPPELFDDLHRILCVFCSWKMME